jgi:hypothetical protein
MGTQKRTRYERTTIGGLSPPVETNFGCGEVNRPQALWIAHEVHGPPDMGRRLGEVGFGVSGIGARVVLRSIMTGSGQLKAKLSTEPPETWYQGGRRA